MRTRGGIRGLVNRIMINPPVPILEFDYVNAAMKAENANDALRELMEPLRGHRAVLDFDLCWHDLLERQAAGSIALDQEIALPHTRTSGVGRLITAIGRHPHGFHFDDEHRRIRLVVLCLSPKEQPGEYLRFLGQLVTKLRDRAVKAGLLAAADGDQLVRVLGSRADDRD